MASPLEAAGATKEPSQFAPLTMDRYITGMATQRSPLRDADVSYEYAKFYSASRYDSIIDGVNTEINAKQNLARRYGSSVYNTQEFTPISRWYPFRVQIDGRTQIRVMADCAEAVYDATGPNTKRTIWAKLVGSGSTYFQSVGNTLYFSDGLSLNKWSVPALSNQRSKNYKPGQTIEDPAGNIQVAEGGITIGIVGVSVAGNVVTLYLDPTSTAIPDNFNALVGIRATFSNMTVATYLNGQTLAIASVPTDSSFTVSFAAPDAPLAPETGSFTTGSGITAASGPSWNPTRGGITQDGGQQWINKGSSVTKWGITAPVNAPSVSQQALPQTYPAWSRNTYYSTCYLIYHGANLIEEVTGFGNTGSTEPIWNDTTVGDTTSDGSVTWTYRGDGTYAPGGTYAAGALIIHADAGGTLYFFKCVTAGIAGASTVFTSTLGAPVQDGSVVWQNVGIAQQWSSITSSTVTGGFGLIPLDGGGSLIVGMGQNAANGTPIALPTGYNTSNMVAWSTAGTGFSGTSAVTAGVFQSSVAGGVLNSSFQKDNTGGGFAFAASSNWAAAAWSADATPTLTTVGSFQVLTFKTAAGAELAIIAGSLANGALAPIPSGFAAANFLYTTGMSGTTPVNHVLQGVSFCRLNAATLAAENLYDDNSGNTWSGTQNVFGIFWKAGQGVTTASVTNGNAILIPVAGGNNLAIVAALNLAHGSSFGLPTGFSAATAQVTCGAAGFTTSGGNHSHGWDCTTTGLTSNGVYRDGSGNTWNMTENCFAIASVLTTTAVAQPQTIIDDDGFRQTIIKSGVSGASKPAWNEAEGATTTDNGAIWQDTGSQSLATTGTYQYAYSFKSSVFKGVSTASPRSLKITFQVGNFGIITGDGPDDPQDDTIVIWRTNVGGSDLVRRAEIPAILGQKWTFNDQGGDETLDNFIVAPENGANDPPPAGLIALAYHGRRIWGYVGNVVQYATGPDVTAGNGNEAWSPSLAFPLPDAGARLVPITLNNGGLLCFTASDVYCIFGTGTASNPYFDRVYAAGIGLLNYDALDVIGATIHLFTTARKQVSMDPSAGYTETGFPIGDQFKTVTTGTVKGKLYNPATAYVTWLEQESGDTALFVADGQVGWFRYAPISAPDRGFVWSPRAEIEGGTSAVQAVEILPGLRSLLIGPLLSGPILMRDQATNSDNGVVYSDCFVDIGSIQLAQPGSVAEVAFVTLDSEAVGTPPICGILFDETRETDNVKFDMLEKTANDPPDLEASETLFMDRFSTMQNGVPILCRHMQLRVQWEDEDAPSELVQHTIYGAKYDERVQA